MSRIDLSPLSAGVPARASLERCVVVSCYASGAFFKKLRRELKPESVAVVLDDGARTEVVDEVREAVGKRRLQRLGFGHRPSGLVHVKAYLCSWRVPGRKNPRHVFVWGSANASGGGFGRNAEGVAAARVYRSRHRALFRWFEQAATSHQVAGCTVQLDGVRVELPAFDVRTDPAPATFDAWLQRGRLCHAYTPDPSFLRISLRLKRALPVGDEGAILADQGLAPDRGAQLVRFDYLGLGREGRPRGGTQWRARHFIETNLGAWTSEQCFHRGRRRFGEAGRDEREAIIERVLEAGEARHAAWVDDLGARLRHVERALRGRGLDPAEWFEVDAGGAIIVSHYKTAALQQLIDDQQKARTDEMRARFVLRFDFPRVPRFRADVEAWEAFAASLAETLLMQLQKARVGNRLAAAFVASGVVRVQVDERSPGVLARSVSSDPKAVLRRIRARWPEVRDDVERILMEGLDTD